MLWIKKGLIIKPLTFDWMVSHAQLPVVDHISGNIYRVYFSGRNKDNKSQIGYADVDLASMQTLEVNNEPVLRLGAYRAFDMDGVFPHWLVNYNGKKYLYYTGWKQMENTPYDSHMGLAISTDSGRTFERYSKTPILHRTNDDPYMIFSPCVRVENNLWRMWYNSCVEWIRTENGPKPRYHIKYAESNDGLSWRRDNTVCIDFNSKDEWAITRPCVLKEDDIYKMWYSCRSDEYVQGGAGHYRIGYAESPDGINWKRMDDLAGIDVSESGWDSEMVAYAYVFNHNGKKYMLYNGNRYGKDGIGYAILGTN